MRKITIYFPDGNGINTMIFENPKMFEYSWIGSYRTGGDLLEIALTDKTGKTYKFVGRFSFMEENEGE